MGNLASAVCYILFTSDAVDTREACTRMHVGWWCMPSIWDYFNFIAISVISLDREMLHAVFAASAA